MSNLIDSLKNIKKLDYDTRLKIAISSFTVSTIIIIILYKYIYWAEYGIWPEFIDKNCKNNSEYSYLKISKLKIFQLYLIFHIYFQYLQLYF